MAKNKSQYDSTLNLPKTLFEMRAGLPKKEPVMLKDWDDNDLYNQLMKHNEGKPQFILHDGPPYANGNIHMGTALNKIIKDIIIRDKNMEGFQAPYVPGFDTHGLPIELKALSSVGDKKKDISKLELRQICEKFATEHIDIMSDQFKRLGVIGDFEHPYLTLKPEFEARQIETFWRDGKEGLHLQGPEARVLVPGLPHGSGRGRDRVRRGRLRFHLRAFPRLSGPQRCAGKARHPDGQDLLRHLDHHHLDSAR